MKNSTKVIVVLTTFCLILLFFLHQSTSNGQTLCPEKYFFLTSDLDCTEDPSDEIKNLEIHVTNEIKEKIKNGEAEKISVFYRNLNNRRWFGVNENVNFSPGSLLKLPLAIAYFKLSEIEPNVLEQRFQYRASLENENLYDLQIFKPESKLVVGGVYSVRELIERMIKYSDNEAVPILAESINKDFFDKVFIDLGVYFPKTGGIEQEFISVKTYGAILRSLYLASYLNQDSSNELLEIMSQSDFKAGIVAGVPREIKVAHKFGERTVLDTVSHQKAYSELHDCGIVYDLPNPYILCIMTRGGNANQLAEVIGAISSLVYKKR